MTIEEEQENQGIKVSDRRRFQPDGTPHEAPPEGSSSASAATEAGQPAEAEAPAQAPPQPDRGEIPADFLTLLLSLAASAQSALGISAHPVTGRVEKNLAEAKYSIDLLSVLQEKTRGNLSPEEEKFLQTLLYDLRLRYVEEKQAIKT